MDKVINKITAIGCSLVGKEGYAVTLTADGTVSLLTTGNEEPYGIIVKGCDSLTPSVYPSAIADGSLEIMSEVGQCAMVRISAGSYAVTCNAWLGASGESAFYYMTDIQQGYRIWGVAVADASDGAFCMMRFQPMYVFSRVT